MSAYPNISRWFQYISSKPEVASVCSQSKAEEVRVGVVTCGCDLVTSPAPQVPKAAQEDVGKFVELPGAEMGKVIVRFPPEASG